MRVKVHFYAAVAGLLPWASAFAAEGPSESVASGMADRANFSFERLVGPETAYFEGFKVKRQSWAELVGRPDWPADWVVRMVGETAGRRTLRFPKPDEVAGAAAAFSVVDAENPLTGRVLQITGDPGDATLIMGEEAIPLIDLRNFLKADRLEFVVRGRVRTDDATGEVKLGLEFTQHSEPIHGVRGSDFVKAPSGSPDWQTIELKSTVQRDVGRWARIAISAKGNTGTVWFDDLSLTVNGRDLFELLAEVREWRDGTTRTARLQASGPDAVVWSEDPGQKVLGWSEPPAGEATPGIRLTAARGEFESVQIAIKPLVDLKGLTVEFSNLEGPRPWYYFGAPVIPANQLEAREVVLVNRAFRWDFIDPTGQLPDPLAGRDSYDFKAGASRALWITLEVPRETSAGEYRGTIKLGGPLDLTIPLTVLVRNFALPELTSFNLNAEIKPRTIALYDKRPWLESMKDYLPDLAAHRARSTNFEIFPIPVITDGKVSLDPASTAESDATIDYALSLGFHTFTTSKSPFYLGGAAEKNLQVAIWKDTPWAAQKYDAGIARTSPDFQTLYGDFLQVAADHYRAKGTIDHILQYIYDEPFLWKNREEQIGALNEIYAKSREVGFRNFLTTEPSPEYPNIDVWCPLFYGALSHLPENRKVQKEGQEVMWYHNEFYTINRTALNARLVGWFTWRYDFDGYLIWSMNYWAEGNPWDQVRLDGDGYLIYPNPAGEGKPFSSIRWELFREGIEDYDYFVLLKERAEAVLSDDGAPAERKQLARESLALFDEIPKLIPEDATTLNTNRNPADYADLRERMGDAIESLQP